MKPKCIGEEYGCQRCLAKNIECGYQNAAASKFKMKSPQEKQCLPSETPHVRDEHTMDNDSTPGNASRINHGTKR